MDAFDFLEAVAFFWTLPRFRIGASSKATYQDRMPGRKMESSIIHLGGGA